MELGIELGIIFEMEITMVVIDYLDYWEKDQVIF
jgi:hypothetical protein